ncbi:MAG TPA: sigma-70 family RNA polymerase sigma factor, partial [Alphaproteobacteria bacterium]|nr:sigma-70 family RNA polymerase sigma factor [Alphaproteobacteria bacterium]
MQQLVEYSFADSSEAADLSDAAVADRVRRGDGAAFEIIMRRHNRLLFRLARSIADDDSEAEDIVQETYVRAFAGLGDFAGHSRLSTWLARIAINEALGRRRRGRRFTAMAVDDDGRQPREDALATWRSDHHDPERLAASSELRRLIEQAIDDLPEAFRSVFMLRA